MMVKRLRPTRHFQIRRVPLPTIAKQNLLDRLLPVWPAAMNSGDVAFLQILFNDSVIVLSPAVINKLIFIFPTFKREDFIS